MPLPYKIVLLGDSSVGKTSLVHRFTSGSFNPHSANTIGAAFISTDYTYKDRTVKFEIWDTAGQERYKSLTPMYYRNALVALVCFDLSSPEASFDRAKYWIDQLLTMGPSDIKIHVVGNKLDLIEGKDQDGDMALIEEYCSEKNITITRTSAKLGRGIQDLFNSIVEEISQETFDLYEHTEATEHQEDNILLNFRNNRSGCC